MLNVVDAIPVSGLWLSSKSSVFYSCDCVSGETIVHQVTQSTLVIWLWCGGQARTCCADAVPGVELAAVERELEVNGCGARTWSWNTAARLVGPNQTSPFVTRPPPIGDRRQSTLVIVICDKTFFALHSNKLLWMWKSQVLATPLEPASKETASMEICLVARLGIYSNEHIKSFCSPINQSPAAENSKKKDFFQRLSITFFFALF